VDRGVIGEVELTGLEPVTFARDAAFERAGVPPTCGASLRIGLRSNAY
jgi:hypothetical protein